MIQYGRGGPGARHDRSLWVPGADATGFLAAFGQRAGVHKPQLHRAGQELWAAAGVHHETVQHASRVIADWIGFYNHQRPHQALKIKTPAEVYALAA